MSDDEELKTLLEQRKRQFEKTVRFYAAVVVAILLFSLVLQLMA